MASLPTQFDYYRGRAAELFGQREVAEACFRAALSGADHDRARRRLAKLALPGEDYHRVLARLHGYLEPKAYVEIGVFEGRSLRLVGPGTRGLGVDPAPRLKKPLKPNTRVFTETSDAFFAGRDVIAELGGERVELAFIDGMHLFEFALRDFIALERLAHRRSVIVVHDCHPIDRRSAERERSTRFWTGDVWRMLALLQRHRPDLAIGTVACPPSGLGLIANLDPDSRVLTERYAQLVEEGLSLDFALLEHDPAATPRRLSNDWASIRRFLDAREHRAASV